MANYAREDLLQSIGCALSFGFTPAQTVLEVEQRLAYGIGEANAG
jgi:hypothetical protein